MRAAHYLIHLAGPPPSSPATLPIDCEPTHPACRWRAHTPSNNFEANAAMVLIVLICALICALALNTAIRCFLRVGGAPETRGHKPDPEAAAERVVVGSTVAYTAGVELAGAEAECAICLSEFEEGEEVQVLGGCNHGFHVHCIERWFCSHTSCPTCRRSCLPPGHELGGSGVGTMPEAAGAGHQRS